MCLRKKFNENGFVLEQGLLCKNSITALLNEFNRVIENRLKSLNLPTKNSFWDNLKQLFDADLNAYLESLTILPKIVTVQNLFLNSNITDKIKLFGVSGAAFQTSPVFHIMADNLKVPNGYFGFGAHQDWTSLQSSLNNITVWIPLVDVGADNFTLDIVPGSHKYGLMHGTQKENYYEPDPDIVKQYTFEKVNAKVGDVLFMSNFLLHKSSTEGDADKIRLALSHRFEDFDEPTFIERGYPFTQKKHIERVEINNSFPTKQQILKIYE